jgi:voltage-gated sodium channel
MSQSRVESDRESRPGTGNLAARAVGSRFFGGTVIAAILAGAVLVGLETVPSVFEAHGGFILALDRVVLAIFVMEAILKIAAEGKRPWRYFANPWNVFDFSITAICLLPLNSTFAQVLRLARVARSLRLITAIPDLQLIVGALLRSLPSFGWITLLLLLLIYVYSVTGVFLFGKGDPERFGSLWSSVLTMFSVLTLEGWFDVMDNQIKAGSRIAGPLFFVSFILSGTMIFLNLLVGVIVNSMSEMPGTKEPAQAPAERSPLPSLRTPETTGDDHSLLAERVQRIETLLERVAADVQAMRRSGEHR